MNLIDERLELGDGLLTFTDEVGYAYGRGKGRGEGRGSGEGSGEGIANRRENQEGIESKNILAILNFIPSMHSIPKYK